MSESSGDLPPPNYSFDSLRPDAISPINSRVLPRASQLSSEDQEVASTSPESIKRAAEIIAGVNEIVAEAERDPPLAPDGTYHNADTRTLSLNAA